MKWRDTSSPARLHRNEAAGKGISDLLRLEGRGGGGGGGTGGRNADVK